MKTKGTLITVQDALERANVDLSEEHKKQALTELDALIAAVPDGLKKASKTVPICEENTVIQLNIEHTFTPIIKAAKLLSEAVEVGE